VSVFLTLSYLGDRCHVSRLADAEASDDPPNRNDIRTPSGTLPGMRRTIHQSAIRLSTASGTTVDRGRRRKDTQGARESRRKIKNGVAVTPGDEGLSANERRRILADAGWASCGRGLVKRSGSLREEPRT